MARPESAGVAVRMLAAVRAIPAGRAEVDPGTVCAPDDHGKPDGPGMLAQQFLRLWHMAGDYVLPAAVLASGGAIVGRGGIDPVAAGDHCPRDGLFICGSGKLR